MDWKQPKVLWPVGIVAALAIAAGGAAVAELASRSSSGPTGNSVSQPPPPQSNLQQKPITPEANGSAPEVPVTFTEGEPPKFAVIYGKLSFHGDLQPGGSAPNFHGNCDALGSPLGIGLTIGQLKQSIKQQFGVGPKNIIVDHIEWDPQYGETVEYADFYSRVKAIGVKANKRYFFKALVNNDLRIRDEAFSQVLHCTPAFDDPKNYQDFLREPKSAASGDINRYVVASLDPSGNINIHHLEE